MKAHTTAHTTVFRLAACPNHCPENDRTLWFKKHLVFVPSLIEINCFCYLSNETVQKFGRHFMLSTQNLSESHSPNCSWTCRESRSRRDWILLTSSSLLVESAHRRLLGLVVHFPFIEQYLPSFAHHLHFNLCPLEIHFARSISSLDSGD